MRKKLLLSFVATFLLVVSGFVLDVNANPGATYTVHRVNNNGTFEAASYTSSDFNAAYQEMKRVAAQTPNVVVRSNLNKSPLQIVAADRARVQSYPYRRGNIGAAPAAAELLTIYNNTALTDKLTYIPSHYEMFYYGTQLSGNYLVSEVQINGARGYVDLNKIDIIPLVFYENNLSILLGGNEDFYASEGKTPEQAYSMQVKYLTYTVVYDQSAKTYDLTLNVRRTYPTFGQSSTAFAIAPSTMPVGTYYSADGINYFTDPELKNRANNGEPFYAYYQWLPVRSDSTVTAKDLNTYLVKRGFTSDRSSSKYSVMVGNEQLFIDYGKKYGMNPLLIFAQAGLESAFGTSNFARDRLNLFGWNAVDSNPDNASTFDGMNVALDSFMGSLFRGYFSVNDWRNQGPSYGNKASGVTVHYASDPYYGNKISSLAYFVDYGGAGLKDYDNYTLGLLNDKESIPVYKEQNTGSGTYYNTKSSGVNQVVTILKNENGFVRTNPMMPIRNGVAVDDKVDLNLYRTFAYIQSGKVKSIKNATKVGGYYPVDNTEEVITVKDQDKDYIVDTGGGNLIIRKSWTTQSDQLGTIPNGAQVKSTGIASNGWVRVVYNNITGFVSGDFLFEKPSDGVVVTPQTKEYIVNADGNLNVRASWDTSSAILTRIPDKTIIQSTAITSNGWIRVTYNGVTGFVSASLVKEYEQPTEPSFKRGGVNGDGKVTLVDLAMVRAHILGNIVLSGDQFSSADVNADGKITLVDLAMIRAHILGNITLD